jgi:predicted transcriptional regulator
MTTTDKAHETGGWVLRICREAAGLTRGEVADRAGISTPQLGRMERGDVPPLKHFDELQRVTDAIAHSTIDTVVVAAADLGVMPSEVIEQLERGRKTDSAAIA